MTFFEQCSAKAVWSYRIAILGFFGFAGTFVWHRFFDLQPPLALKLFGASIALAIVAVALAAYALVDIWNEGRSGAVRASAAVLISASVLAVPLWWLPALMQLPRIYDVTTDPSHPPAFDKIAIIRQGQANPAHYDSSFRPLQLAGYPDIKPLTVPRPITEVYMAVRETVKELNWQVIGDQSPETARSGYIEAVDRTFLFGFTDDIAIRITGSARSARIDIRSSSRFGLHDLGRNAERIRTFLAQVKTRLANIERAERMERVAAARAAAEKDRPKRRRGGREEDGSDN